MTGPATAAQPVVFNWGKDCKCKVRHWSSTAKPCRHGCGATTHLRDFDGLPAHKVCAERIANARLERQTAAATRTHPNHPNHPNHQPSPEAIST